MSGGTGEKPQKPPVRTAGLRVEIGTWDLLNSMKRAYSTSTFGAFTIAVATSESRVAVWTARAKNPGSITAPGRED